jgi:hypothetical protein
MCFDSWSVSGELVRAVTANHIKIVQIFSIEEDGRSTKERKEKQHASPFVQSIISDPSHQSKEK